MSQRGRPVDLVGMLILLKNPWWVEMGSEPASPQLMALNAITPKEGVFPVQAVGPGGNMGAFYSSSGRMLTKQL